MPEEVSGTERGRLLFKLADLMEQRIEQFAALDAVAHVRHARRGIAVLRYYAGWADKINGKTIETNDKKLSYTRHEPIGVMVGILVPWNVPRFPAGVINIVNGYRATAGQAISEHPIIRKVAFTGSTLTGRKIMQAAAKSDLKPVTLELGGKSPAAVKWAIHGIYFNHRQNCSAGSRIFVQEGIYDEFLKRFTEQALSIKRTVPRYLGGNRIGNEGYFIQPTIFTECQPHMKIVQEEISGPVASSRVIEQANNTTYGLAAGFRVARAIEVGNMWINCSNQAEIQMSFGGELAEYALESYTSVKAVHVNLGLRL
ncbi:Aldehyde/histidinol dehydrogenase [Tylopilus felleus]